LITIDINEELESRVRKYFEEGGLSSSIEYIIGNATQIIPTIDAVFDLVFIDADKMGYANYYDLVIDKLRPGGIILADNVLRTGKVLNEKKDKDAMAIDAFNRKVNADARVEQVLLPVRDGILMIRKLSLQNF
jgi:predicted O-methyltransferase YrrM